MAGLVVEILLKGLLSIGLTMALLIAFPSFLTLGESDFQTIGVLSFYVYCCIALFTFSTDKLFHIISIPILTQFLHLFQKYSFSAGANSLWRLMPFVILCIYFFDFFIRKKIALADNEKLFLLVWTIFSFFYLIISPNVGQIVLGATLLGLIVLPCYFVYLRYATTASNFCSALEKYLCLSYLILGFGTFGLVITGAAYKGSDNLLATRNISDTNITMAYFVLLWPFALLYITRLRWMTFVMLTGVLAIFIAVVGLSFSRGAVFIIAPYLLISLWLISTRSLCFLIALLTVVLLLFMARIENFLDTQDLTYFWKLRFGGMSARPAFGKLLETSGRNEIQAIAYQLFLESPLIGHGTGSFEKLGPGYREAHSLWYTLLTENGLLGAILVYLLLFKCGWTTWKAQVCGKKYGVLYAAVLVYLIFNHTVGSVFIIIPSKSVTINCIAPILLMCQYFYAKRIALFDETS
ncbi:O-antigen ligase family protein [Dyadobacter aurulentus]|uniref:O-antigen ligase family protein n=1 Tax=Dyadobacter sp. UC 10 TaxID=2605428 RepID=UPI0011F18343|nr:O-antigen ligase family protein [Dyadobacter sp. UC 10]KAA0990026.1 O-antigen ligase family protein [Dyadobacter sp. UC 10]